VVGFFRDHPELLLGFREGRREVLESVYRAHVRSVERYLRALARRSGKRDLAQPSAVSDLIQETFVHAFAPEARRRYDGLRPYGAYLAAIARNCFVDALRVQGREVAEDPGALPADLEDVAGPEEPRDLKVLAVIAAYVGQLPARLKDVCEQRFVLGRSQEEASALLGLSRRALRTNEQRLKRGLRKALQSAGISLAELGHRPAETATPAAAPPALHGERSAK
jgi:RNA polymerase sigma-70 factor (ECF subfamily)